jgi:hypothetical protein
MVRSGSTADWHDAGSGIAMKHGLTAYHRNYMRDQRGAFFLLQPSIIREANRG